MPAEVINFHIARAQHSDRRARQMLDEERERKPAFSLSRTPDGIYIGVDKLLTEREAQALYRLLGVMLGVDHG